MAFSSISLVLLLTVSLLSTSMSTTLQWTVLIALNSSIEAKIEVVCADDYDEHYRIRKHRLFLYKGIWSWIILPKPRAQMLKCNMNELAAGSLTQVKWTTTVTLFDSRSIPQEVLWPNYRPKYGNYLWEMRPEGIYLFNRITKKWEQKEIWYQPGAKRILDHL